MTAKIDTKWFEDVCERGPRPLVTDGWIRLWMTGHFVSADHLEDTDPTGPVVGMLWTPTAATGLVIESNTKWTPEMTENRPGVIIKRNGWRRVRLGVGDRMMGTDPGDGQERFENGWQGSHTLFCIANDGAEVELLAAEVFRELNQSGPAVRAVLDLKRLEVVEVGEVAILEEGRQNFVVPVTLAYTYSERWILQRQVPAIKRISLTLT